MNVESVKDIVGISLITLLKISMPVLVTILLVGVIISLVQALTQIQEPTLSLLPKFISLLCVLFLSMSYIGGAMSLLVENITSLIINIE